MRLGLYVVLFVFFCPCPIEAQQRARRDTNSTFSSSSNLNRKLEKTKEGRVIVKIGHLGAAGLMPNEDKVLEISKQQCVEEGLLGDDVEFEYVSLVLHQARRFVSRATCSEALEGVAVAADLFHIQQVRAFLGPYCASGMSPPFLRRLRAGGRREDVDLLERARHLLRLLEQRTCRPRHLQDALEDLLQEHQRHCRGHRRPSRALRLAAGKNERGGKNSQIAIVTNTGTTAFDRVAAFEEVLHRRGVTVVKKVMFEESGDANDMIQSGLLTDLRNTARSAFAP